MYERRFKRDREAGLEEAKREERRRKEDDERRLAKERERKEREKETARRAERDKAEVRGGVPSVIRQGERWAGREVGLLSGIRQGGTGAC